MAFLWRATSPNPLACRYATGLRLGPSTTEQRMGEMSETLTKPAVQHTTEVLYEASDGVATITLNRPQRMNAISGPMLASLSELLLKANADPKVRVVILTGAGRAFCVGLDLVDA